MRGPRAHELAWTAAGVAAWLARLAADHRKIRADPRYPELNEPLGGRPLAIMSTDGTPLRALEFGNPDAPATVVLVHGWTCAAKIWIRQINALASDEVRVIAYDLRGHAQSGRPEELDYSIDAHAGDLDAVLRAVCSDGRRAVVAGHSLGGMTIVAWAGDHPDEVCDLLAGAVLVTTGVDGLIAQSPILRAPDKLAKVREFAGRLLLGAAVPLPRGPTPLSFRVIRWIALSKQASPAEVAFCERIILSCNRDVRALCGNTLSGLDLYESIASLSVPTVIVGGERDKLTPPPHVRRLADALPHVVEEIVIPGCGHMAPVSHPDEVTEPILRLVRDHERVPVATDAEEHAKDADARDAAGAEVAAAS
ncbi:MAG: alpha/beta fold hydrolase [Solirubrobacteraceae bacterium]